MKTRRFFSRLAGVVLILTAVLGLGFSIAGIVLANLFLDEVHAALTSGFDLAERTLNTTDEGLSAAERSLQQVQATLGSIQGTLESVTASVQNSLPTIDAVSDLLKSALPGAIATTQRALDSAQAAARTLDTFLAALAQIPLIGDVVSQPEVSLNEAIGEVNRSLDNIPTALEQAQGGVEDAAGSTSEVETGIGEVAGQMGAIGTVTGEAQGVIDKYQGILQDMHTRLARFEARTFAWLRGIRIALILALAWMALAQISLILQGWERLGIGRAAPARAEALPESREEPV